MNIDNLKEAGSLLEGHFKLSSGSHSNRYIQCAKLMQNYMSRATVGSALMSTSHFMEWHTNIGSHPFPDVIIGGAYGGIKFAMVVESLLSTMLMQKGSKHEVRSIFCERVPEIDQAAGLDMNKYENGEGNNSKIKSGKFQFRRGFEIKPGEKVFIAEDVTTTGKSIGEVAALVEDQGGEVIGAISIIDRRTVKNTDGLYWKDKESESFHKCITPFIPLVTLDVNTWTADECPLCKEGVPITKPGSRT